jgi:methionine synthase I (cobalamin-dependent)
MSRLFSFLTGGPLLTDGAWGTELARLGLPAGQPADLWNIDHPERVAQVAQAYVDAGSRVLLTNTFRSNRIALEACGRAEEVHRLNSEGVAISRAAARNRAYVFASIGPTGRVLIAGDADPSIIAAALREQVRACTAADALLLETFSDLEEARIGADAALAIGLPVIVSFAFDTGKRKDRTMMGVTPEQAAKFAMEHGLDGIGANCGVGIEQAIGLCQRLRAVAPTLPVWIKPNAGLPVIENGEAVYRVQPEDFASHVPALLEAGASFLGGCCGTNPAFIRAAAAKMSPCASF